MKAQNLLCCATLAFVSERKDIRSGGKRYGSHLRTRQKLQLRSNGSDNTSHGDIHLHERPKSRRALFQGTSKSLLSSALLAPALNAAPARAACLSGDIRADCIGVYKLPIDAAESEFAESPEKLRAYAPDIKWVPPVEYPPSYSDALRQLRDQRARVDEARDLVARGAVERSGLVLLDVVPKVGASGAVILRAFGNASNEERNAAMRRKKKPTDAGGGDAGPDPDNNDGNPSTTPRATALEMKAYRVEVALNELLFCLGETDILVGQGLRGDLGVSAAAQILILTQLKDVGREFDALLGAVPEGLASL